MVIDLISQDFRWKLFIQGLIKIVLRMGCFLCPFVSSFLKEIKFIGLKRYVGLEAMHGIGWCKFTRYSHHIINHVALRLAKPYAIF